MKLLAVAGLAAGAAAATKYPAAVLVAAPLGAAALLAGLARCFTNRRSPIADHPLRRAIAGLAIIGLLSLALAAPWYLKNWLADGNPVYPLAGSVFPSRHWDALKDARFRKAHAPGQSAVGALRQVLAGRPLPMAKGGGPDVDSTQAMQNLFTTPLLLVFLPLVPLALWRRRRGPRGAALWMAALAAVFIAGWALCTHQIERFLWPAYGAVAALGAAGAAASGGALGRRAAAGTVLAWVLFAAPMPFLWTRWLADQPTARKLAGLEGPVQLPRVMAAAGHLPPGSRVLLVGEARAALFRVPVLCATVFDTNPLDEALEQSATAAEVAAGLRALGVTHVYYDWHELQRLRDPRRSPGYSVALPDGSLRPPCFALSPEKARLLDEFERDWLEPVMAQGAAGQSPLTGRRLLGRQELWRLKPGRAEGPAPGVSRPAASP